MTSILIFSMLLGQGETSLQSSVSTLLPLQSDPPNAGLGLTQYRCLTLEESTISHVVEQGDHECHFVQPPGTVA